MDFQDVEIKKSEICQFEDGLGVFAKREFKEGEIVLQWNLAILTPEDYQNLCPYERENFCHTRDEVIYYYPDPERHVNRSNHPNVAPDFVKEANIALRNIKKGEELSISATAEEDY